MGLQDSGYQSVRGMLADGSTDIGDEISEMRGTIPLPHFPIAVVCDVYPNPAALTKEEKDALRERVGTQELVDRMPRNTVIARIVTREVDKSDSTERLFFPATPFDAQPIKPGESVFIFYSDPHRSTQVGYWWCRVPEPMDTDDANFTHADRKFEFNVDQSTAERANDEEPAKPGFANGTGTEDSQTLGGDEKEYDKINDEATANPQIIKEPVARFSKRPGDRVIQGSNGTRVVWGMDRTSAVDEEPVEGSPTIDIVATTYELPDDGADPDGSAPRVVTNARGEREVDKCPIKTKGSDNVNEGDPNFADDSARIYVSAKTDADGNFELDITGVPGSDGEVPAIILKADQVRLIAREDCKISVGEDGVGIVVQGKDIILIPAEDGVIKLGGADADKAIMVNNGANAGGTVIGVPIISTMGGGVGLGNSTQGSFATKILVK